MHLGPSVLATISTINTTRQTTKKTTVKICQTDMETQEIKRQNKCTAESCGGSKIAKSQPEMRKLCFEPQGLR